MSGAGRADLALAVVLLAGASAVGIASLRMPVPRFMDYGAGFFPGLLSVLLIVFAALLGARALIGRAPPLAAADATPRRRRMVAAAAVFGGLAAFPLAGGTLGFPVVIAAVGAGVLRVAEVQWRAALPLGAALAAVVQLIFGTALRAPLPLGALWQGG